MNHLSYIIYPVSPAFSDFFFDWRVSFNSQNLRSPCWFRLRKPSFPGRKCCVSSHRSHWGGPRWPHQTASASTTSRKVDVLLPGAVCPGTMERVGGKFSSKTAPPKWVFPKIGGNPQNGWFIMENPIKMEDWRGTPHYFRKHPSWVEFGQLTQKGCVDFSRLRWLRLIRCLMFTSWGTFVVFLPLFIGVLDIPGCCFWISFINGIAHGYWFPIKWTISLIQETFTASFGCFSGCDGNGHHVANIVVFQL